MANTITLQVVRFDDFENADQYDCWCSFSYGDADYTLVRKESLLLELEEAMEDGVEVESLMEELKALPPDTLVAFDG